MATQTSIMSFIQLKDEKVLGGKQRDVYKFIGFNPNCSDREISKGTGMTINCTTGRRNELARYGMITHSGIKYDEETNRYVSTWVVR